MRDVESLFRWAFYADYGITPEQAIERMFPPKGRVLGIDTGCAPVDIKTSLFKMTADEMLTRVGGLIHRVATEQNVDGRAVAAVVAWEYEENWKGRFSDYLQAHIGWGDAGIGWGSIHDSAAQGVRPLATESELRCMRLAGRTALQMIGEIMSNTAKLYLKASGGIWINGEPAVLAFFYNTGDGVAARSAAKRRLVVCDDTRVVDLPVSENPMAGWVMKNLDRFRAYLTRPAEPMVWHAKARAV